VDVWAGENLRWVSRAEKNRGENGCSIGERASGAIKRIWKRRRCLDSLDNVNGFNLMSEDSEAIGPGIVNPFLAIN
jgi:hypothetical protein